MQTRTRISLATLALLITSAAATGPAQGRRQPTVRGSQTRGGAAMGAVCALLTSDDVTAILGAPQPASSTAGHCTWESAPAGKKVVLISQRVSGPAVEPTFAHMHDNPPKGASKVAEQSGLGDKAFSMMLDKGVEFAVLKNQKMIEVQYFTGVPGTSADLEKLRPVALKALSNY